MVSVKGYPICSLWCDRVCINISGLIVVFSVGAVSPYCSSREVKLIPTSVTATFIREDPRLKGDGCGYG